MKMESSGTAKTAHGQTVATALSPVHLKGFESRKIDPEIVTRMGIYSAKRSPDGFVADPQGDVLCFPYFEYDKEVNTKYRWFDENRTRKFAQRAGAPKTFFNADVLLDPASLEELEEGKFPLVITEGEFDCLVAIMAGFPYSVSVPDGAPQGRDHEGNLIEVPETSKGLDPSTDTKFAYLPRMIEYLGRVKEFVIAADGDDSGKRLAKELVRRLGPARCRWVDYPKDEVVKDKKTGKMRAPKDLNEVLEHFGIDAVQLLIENAPQWPVKGLYRISEYPDFGEPVTYETGISAELDEIFRLYPGAFVVATGIPGMGKSTLINQISVNMAKIHGWPICMFSGEMPTVPYVSNALKTAFLGKHRSQWTAEDKERAQDFLQRKYLFIDHDPKEDEDEIDLDYLIDKASTAVHRDGAKMLIVDPWNELEHKRDRHFSMTDYVGDAIRKLKRFGKYHDCCVCVVAHPRKVDGCPGLYDIADSAHWANKPDLGLVVHSDDPFQTRRTIYVPKVRFSSAGRKGEIELEFDRHLELFMPVPSFEP